MMANRNWKIVRAWLATDVNVEKCKVMSGNLRLNGVRALVQHTTTTRGTRRVSLHVRQAEYPKALNILGVTYGEQES